MTSPGFTLNCLQSACLYFGNVDTCSLLPVLVEGMWNAHGWEDGTHGWHTWMGKQKENKDTRKTVSICAHQVRTTRTNSTLTKGIDDTGVFHVFHVWIWFAQRPSFSSYELKDKRWGGKTIGVKKHPRIFFTNDNDFPMGVLDPIVHGPVDLFFIFGISNFVWNALFHPRFVRGEKRMHGGQQMLYFVPLCCCHSPMNVPCFFGTPVLRPTTGRFGVGHTEFIQYTGHFS